MSAAIEIAGLGKRYIISHQKTASYSTLRDDLVLGARRVGRTLLNPFLRRRDNSGRRSTEEFWALRDLSFEIQSGDVVGIIGKNGAGKSTLLKVLSRIVHPTEGRVVMRGRIASLLEVGTGFHPELTGRENIYLNGSILGMRRQEIRAKFNEIVEFAEVEKFLDTPVKRYSSGMYVRLAFAVAAHLEPEILVIDEVLAVGDFAFQNKCLAKMREVANAGRTILFVSHNMGIVASFCRTAVLLEKGRMVARGDVKTVVENYMKSKDADSSPVADLRHSPFRERRSIPIFTKAELRVQGRLSNNLSMGEGLSVRLDYEMDRLPRGLRIGVGIYSMYNERLLNFSPTLQAPELLDNAPARGVVICDIPRLNLMAGRYLLSFSSADNEGELDHIRNCMQIDVVEHDVFGTGKIPHAKHGNFYLDAHWECAS